jgi:Ala-tRNA(Pro) deacylase
MTIAARVRAQLESQSIDYEIVPHPHTESSMATAQAAHVPGDRLAKAVIVKRGEAYIMVVVPSDYHVHLGLLHKHLGQDIGLATERELVALFPDCEEGAIPPIGAAYGLPTVVDSLLLGEQEVYFESGDHGSLVRVSGEQFLDLLADAEQMDVGQHV